jgi:hypothetical protein
MEGFGPKLDEAGVLRALGQLRIQLSGRPLSLSRALGATVLIMLSYLPEKADSRIVEKGRLLQEALGTNPVIGPDSRLPDILLRFLGGHRVNLPLLEGELVRAYVSLLSFEELEEFARVLLNERRGLITGSKSRDGEDELFEGMSDSLYSSPFPDEASEEERRESLLGFVQVNIIRARTLPR